MKQTCLFYCINGILYKSPGISCETRSSDTRYFKFNISNTMILGKLVMKCPRKPREDLWKSRGTFFYKSSQGLKGHLITNLPNVMLLVCNTMIDEEI